VSFATDVMPILEQSCGFASCHGSPSAPQAGMYLGTDGHRTYSNIVGVAATNYSMKRVTPSDAQNSYLLHRIDNDACTLPGCTSTACAELMPQGNPSTLPDAQLDTIRGWIVQGAKNDLPATSDAGSTTDAGGTDAGETDAGGD
jgi:hypothetical protein